MLLSLKLYSSNVGTIFSSFLFLQNFIRNPASSSSAASSTETSRLEVARIEEERLRKLAEEEEAAKLESSPLQQAWSILMDSKKHKLGSDLPSLLDELGLEDAEDLADLSAENVPRIAALLKDAPRNKFLQLVARAAPASPPAPSPSIGSPLQVPVRAGMGSTECIDLCLTSCF